MHGKALAGSIGLTCIPVRRLACLTTLITIESPFSEAICRFESLAFMKESSSFVKKITTTTKKGDLSITFMVSSTSPLYQIQNLVAHTPNRIF